MKNNVFKYLASAALATGLSLAAQATSITGGISFGGGPISVNTGDLATGTAITGFGSIFPVSVTGSYSSVPVPPALTPVVTTTGFTFTPALVPNPVSVWSFVSGGNTYSFDLSAIQTVSQGIDVNGTHFLTISGTGMLHITGFTDTLGSYLLTANSAAATFSFSSSNGALPDGGTTAILMGAALSGLALLRRKLA